ncbi:MAG: hypothetical protein HY584_03415 [Candidatus Omnitrophica bacterium]|nr:hypothetical protein [Candidatus Omnitrophota bacterium]
MSLFALSVDLGHIFVTKTELQNTADSAALAAVVEIRNGLDAARQKALAFAEAHAVAGTYIDIEPGDIVFGRYNINTNQFQANGLPTNAVEVNARKTEGAPSGPLALFFARFFDKDFSNVRALSIAVLDPRVTGVRGKNRLLPYSVVNFIVDQDLDGNYDLGSVINIHPRNDAPGNFGFLDLDGGSNDVTELRYYIEHGYDKDFTIPPGGSIEVLGSTGIDGNSLLSSFQAIIGEEVFLPVHNWVLYPGSNAIFNVVSLLAVKVLDVKLNGNVDKRYIKVKLVNFYSSVLAVDPNAPENNSVAKPRLVL